MKKTVTLILIAAMVLSLAACNITVNTEKTSPAHHKLVEVSKPDTTQAGNPAEDAETTAQKASKAYEAYLASIYLDDYSPASAAILDLDKNGVPELIYDGGYVGGFHILSYGASSGLAVFSPVLYSSTPAKVSVSEDGPYLYFSDKGHTYGTAHYHEVVCFKASDNGLEFIGTVSGDDWSDAPENVYTDSDAFDAYNKEKVKAVETATKSLVGLGEFTDYDSLSVKTNVEQYLNNSLSIDISAKRQEFLKFEESARAAVIEKAKAEPYEFFCGDFDRNGTFEAFAFCGKESTDENGYDIVTGKPLFVNSELNVTEFENDSYSPSIRLYHGAYRDYFYTPTQKSKNVNTVLYYTEGNDCVKYPLPESKWIRDFDLSSANAYSNSFAMTEIVYNAELKNLDHADGFGKTYQTYYFYDTPSGLKEYGGIEITEGNFEAEGGGKYLKAIKDSGYSIYNIIYRDNGIIVVNVYKENDGTYSTGHITFKMSASSLYPVDEDFVSSNEFEVEDFYAPGFCKTALIESIAVYSKAFGAN